MLSLSRARVRSGVLVALLFGLPLGWSSPAGASSSADWRWPLAGVPTVLRPFQPPPTPYAAGHRGVDLAAPTGASVLAAGNGVIGFAGMLAGRGVVTVVHGALRTTYEPVRAVVHVGQPVMAGGLLGHLQPPTGHCGAGRSCLHWGLLRGEVYLDPLMLLGLTHSILLPVWGFHPPYAGAARSDVGGSGDGLQIGRAPPPVAARAAARPPSSRPLLPTHTSALVLLGAGLLLTAGGLRLGSSPRRRHTPRTPP